MASLASFNRGVFVWHRPRTKGGSWERPLCVCVYLARRFFYILFPQTLHLVLTSVSCMAGWVKFNIFKKKKSTRSCSCFSLCMRGWDGMRMCLLDMHNTPGRLGIKFSWTPAEKPSNNAFVCGNTKKRKKGGVIHHGPVIVLRNTSIPGPLCIASRCRGSGLRACLRPRSP